MNIYLIKLNEITIPTKYNKWYINICQQAFNRVLPIDTYTEKHHILPKSLFPEYSKDKLNLATLTTREHFICHWLLTKILPTNPKIIYAFSMMIPNKTSSRYIPKSSITYENSKKKFSKNNQGAKGCKWYTNGVDNKFLRPNIPIPEGFFPGKSFSISTREKISNKAKGKTISDYQKSQISKAHKGVCGYQHTPETKHLLSIQKLNTKASDETKMKQRMAKLGKKIGPRGPYKPRSTKNVES